MLADAFAADEGCGQAAARDIAPDHAWGPSCSGGCEEWLLAHDDMRVKDVLDIKPTFDEEKASNRLELTGAKDQAVLLMAALAQIAGLGASQLRPSVRRMIAGVKPHVPLAGRMVCGGCSADQPSGQKFCGLCGSPMSGLAAAASITSGAAA